MMFRLLTHAIVALSFVQLFPADGGVVEQYAHLPEPQQRYVIQWEDVFPHALAQGSASVDTTGASERPRKVEPTSVGVVTSAESALVVDRKSGEVLFEKNAQAPRSIGSITKLMTAYVFLANNPDLNAPASIQSNDVRYGGIQHVSIGDEVTVGDLLHASLVGSDNSATAALVRLSGLSLGDFVSRMNETAAEIGMRETTFVDSTGLSSENRSTVHDIVALLDATMEHPVIQEATQRPTTSFSGSFGRTYNIPSTNELLTGYLNADPYQIVGGKTGFLPEAGYCFGAIFSERDDHEIAVVVLGSETRYSRFQDAKALASWAYKVFDWSDEHEI